MNYVFDLDGTLLNNDGKLNECNREWLLSLKSQNHSLFINTARPPENVWSGFSETDKKLFDGFSAFNGGFIEFKGTVIKNEIQSSAVEQFVAENNDKTIAISVGNNLFTNDIVKSQKLISILKSDVKDLCSLDYRTNDFFSIRIVCGSDIECREFFKNIHSKYHDHFNITMSSGLYILLMNKKASKTNLIKLLNGRVNYFGDSHNDIDVFKMDGVYKVAPKNACAEILSLANLVLDTTNDETIAIKLKG